MALVTLGGAAVLSAHISMPLQGAWTVSAKVDTATLPTFSQTLACEGGLSLLGTVATGAVVLDSSHVWIVGGGGGLGTQVHGSFAYAQLRDPLQSIADQAGEKLSTSIASDLLSLSLSSWSMGRGTAGAALASLCVYASANTGQAVRWRVLPDGTLWLGAETWPAVTLPATDEIMAIDPIDRRTCVAVSTPTLYPGVSIADIGNAAAVDHWMEHTKVRTWVTTT